MTAFECQVFHGGYASTWIRETEAKSSSASVHFRCIPTRLDMGGLHACWTDVEDSVFVFKEGPSRINSSQVVGGHLAGDRRVRAIQLLRTVFADDPA